MEEVCVSLPEDVELQPVGTVSSIIQQLGKYDTDAHQRVAPTLTRF